MKRLTTKRISVVVAIAAGIATTASGIVAITWKVAPVITRVVEVPDKLDALIARVDSVADANSEMRGEVKTIKQLLQTRMLSQHGTTNGWTWAD